jgi:hypothetical protein
MALDADHPLLRSTSPPALLSRVHPALPLRPEPGPLPGTGDNVQPLDQDAWGPDRLSDLIDRFESSAEYYDEANQRAETAVDYYDGKQLTGEEAAELRRRGQAPVVKNRIRRKIDFLQGLERAQRTDPKAQPQRPQQGDNAEAATLAIRSVTASNKFDQVRSLVWADILKVGWGGLECVLEPAKNPSLNPRVVLRRCKWDRMFWDEFSDEIDFSDASHLGLVIWMDRDEAMRRYGPLAGEVYDETIASTNTGSMYDDKPGWSAWVASDRRKRIRVVQIYFRDESSGEWMFAEFTKGGFLKYGPSPWVNEDGESEHGYIWRSCYIDRENVRYGIIKDMEDVQDAINKRESKALHLASVRQTFSTEGSLGNMTTREMRRELAKPDGHVQFAPGKEFGKDFGVIPNGDQFTAQIQLLQNDTAELELMGPSPALQGLNQNDQSGRAILAQQQSGQMQIGPQLDTLRDMDRETYEKTWRRIRQGWTAPEWIRVTDNQNNIRFVGLNKPAMAPLVIPGTNQPVMDPQTGQPVMQPVIDPMTGQPKIEQNDIAALGVDITIEDAPKMGQLRIESFQTVAELAKMVPSLQQMPAEAWLKLSGIDNYAEVMDMLREQARQAAQQGPSPAQQLQLAGAQAEIHKKEGQAVSDQASASHKEAMAQKLQVEAAAEALAAAHAHADHLVKTARGGLDAHHFIPSAEHLIPPGTHTTPSAEHLMPSAEHLIPPAQPQTPGTGG